MQAQGELAEGLKLSHEVPRGNIFTASFTVKNIGKSVFPGGTLTFEVVYTKRLSWGSDPNDLPGLQPDKSYEFEFTQPVPTFLDGLGWIYVEIASKDGEKVNLYKSIEDGIVEKWGQPFLVVNRELLEIKAELSRLASLLEEASSQ